MRLLLIRHGESQNNVKVHQHFHMSTPDLTGPPPAIIESLAQSWKENDLLTSKGHSQARLLSSKYSSVINAIKKEGHPVRIFSSIQNRPIQTALPLAQTTETLLEIIDDLHEIGGPGPPFPGVRELHQAMVRLGRDGISETAAEIRALDPLVDTSRLQRQSGRVLPRNNDEIYSSVPFTMLQSFANSISHRAGRVKEFLMSKELHDELGEDGLCVVFSHAAFLTFLIYEKLLGIEMRPVAEWEPKDFFDKGGVVLGQHMGNTATHLLDMDREGRCSAVWLNNLSHLVVADGSEIGSLTLEQRMFSKM